MARHAYFEELCALAPLGELTPSQIRELDEHITTCDVCRQATIDYNRFFQRIVPEVTRSDDEYIERRRNDMRAAVMQSVVTIDRERGRERASVEQEKFSFSSLLWNLPQNHLALPFFGGLGAVTLAVAAFWLGAHFFGQVQRGSAQDVVSAKMPTVSQPTPSEHPKVAVPISSNNPSQQALEAALDEERQRNADLEKKLSVEDSKLAAALTVQDALRTQIDQQTRELAATKADLESKTTILAQARSASTSDGVTIAALEVQVHDLNERANTQTASLDRERDLLSHGREIRDIIGARNLHIIDVYDTSTEGATRRPFARAFYTEGKSLVYYAYDLPQRRIDEGKFSYVAWGQSNGSKASIKKIGILYHDDQTQRRWSLDFNDSQVLREIDSVFITMERNDEDIAMPKGKRMLTAYLGTAPNHP